MRSKWPGEGGARRHGEVGEGARRRKPESVLEARAGAREEMGTGVPVSETARHVMVGHGYRDIRRCDDDALEFRSAHGRDGDGAHSARWYDDAGWESAPAKWEGPEGSSSR